MDELTYYGIIHQVPILQGEGLEILDQILRDNQVKNFLEIGTAIGRTSLLAALGHPDRQVVTIEKDPEMAAQARLNFEQYDLNHQITLIEGDARETEIPDLKYDLIFIDAAKGQYRRFFEKYAPYLSDKGLIVSDNMDFHGLVEHPERTHNRHTRGLIRRLKDYRSYLANLEDFETEFLKAGDGIAITRRKKDV